MRFRICTVEQPRLPYAKIASAEYLKRLHAYGGADVRCVRSGSVAEEGERLLKASDGCRRILLDESGERLSTRDWKERIKRWETDREIAFLIGGAEGHGQAVRSAADAVWSLSPLTLQHELALVVLLEQLYRVQSWRRGEPYHREGRPNER